MDLFGSLNPVLAQVSVAALLTNKLRQSLADLTVVASIKLQRNTGLVTFKNQLVSKKITQNLLVDATLGRLDHTFTLCAGWMLSFVQAKGKWILNVLWLAHSPPRRKSQTRMAKLCYKSVESDVLS